MLRSINQPAIAYDLMGLANRGIISVGRESDSAIRLDCQEVPFLLSRKHCQVMFQPDAKMVVTDLNSTNGTYTARRGNPLRKLPAGVIWELMEGDSIGFGGPETIVASRAYVPNPFVFRFFPVIDVSAPNTIEVVVHSTSSEVDALAITANIADRRQRDDIQVDDQSTSIDRLQGLGRQRTLKHKAAPNGNLQRIASRSSPYSRPSTAGASPCTKLKEVLSSHLSCAICQDWLVACHALSCGHMYCGMCLSTWLARKRSCPTCRRAVAGVPVRCFQVDNTINDLLDKGVQVMSPQAYQDRKQKRQHWEDVQGMVVPEWTMTMEERRKRAIDAAARHHQEFMAIPRNHQGILGLLVENVGGQPHLVLENGVDAQ
ncbi:hypothetical protein CEUSTIGMA_g5641.t1 [Chlamydomonas eustigma]|uniref:E3 ubiquitin-protein ligase CHFR n=1 Tax=Chlamydomonas eustigma TaxID=1157962 RepID=A0A250X5K8_9CHLO|nr:hypothetical protein CEUSTIGMA_g5641.t1 [Chlamydomonas eustigma]|eukprot:GAX78199.1 hypothetical protein CEUSTIGMA_g5641.t1 [Chlamydomonas eustigma]